MPLTIVQNTALPSAATGGSRTSTICEPTSAANGTQIVATGNWFAATSTNGGGAWSFVDPYTRFPATAGGFCCDQVALYVPRHRIWVWLLQYVATSGGNNIFRVAVCRDASFGSWYYWDFSPRDLNAAWTTTWFDYPDMAYTNDNLFVTFNAFVGNTWQRAVVFRFPLATLASGGSLGYRWWSTTSNGSIRLCRGAGATMYMGSHNSVTQLRLFHWPDTATGISQTDINVRRWTGGSYSAPGPGNADWLVRTDSRITGAWVGAGTIGFMWTANRDTNHPLPFIRVVRIRETNRTLLDEPDIWSQSAAWAYPAAAANASGEAGFTAFYGGGTRHPSHVIGVKSAAGWDSQITRASTHGPAGQSWGDYLSCIADNPGGTGWVASGYTLQGGSQRQNIEPRHVRFHN